MSDGLNREGFTEPQTPTADLELAEIIAGRDQLCIALERIASYAAGTATKQMIGLTARRALDNLKPGPQEPKPAHAVATAQLARALDGRTILVREDDRYLRLDDGLWQVIPAYPHDLACQLLSAIDTRLTDDAQPAPELTAAMTETRQVRDGYVRLCGEFSDSPQSGQSARISLTVLNRHRKTAGLRALRPAPAGERRDPYMQAREELDELRAALSTLTDRAEASGAITEDEAAEYRQRADPSRPEGQ